MKTKEYVSEYNVIASKFIRDERLSLEIQQNISFVENYVDSVEDSFEFGIEQEIAYRELGVIVYSCIEALMKSVLYEINERCKKRKCDNKECPYRKYRDTSAINHAKVINSIVHLVNTRLFMLFPDEIAELKKYNTMRNYVHISKKIGKKIINVTFDKNYPNRLLDYYYNLLNQLDLCDYYFNSDDSCLKIIDDEGYDSTSIEYEEDRERNRFHRFIYAIRKLLWNEAITKDDESDLIRFNNLDQPYKEQSLKYIAMLSRPILWRYTDDTEYLKAKKELTNLLSKYLCKKFVKLVEKEI